MSLGDIRKRIDLIDYEIVKLLNERMEYALRLKRLKCGIFDPDREEQVMKNIRRFSRNLIRPDFCEALYREIMRESRRIQEQDAKVVGFQGEHGAYSEVAALAYDFALVPMPCEEFADVFQGVATNQLDLGIVPVENSLEGSITPVTDLLIGTDLKIVGEVDIPIHHYLLTLPETELGDIRVVHSHPQAIAQCRGFIRDRGFTAEPFYDTAGAARMLSEQRPASGAAIASKLCAMLYNLKIVAEHIEDHVSNTTRFVILSREEGTGKGNKCSLMFSAKHEVGTLFSVLKIFSDAEINLTRIESRPMRDDPDQYAFLLDFKGSDRDDRVIDSMKQLEEQAVTFKFFGCYRNNVLPKVT
ncbi:MAG: P-protein [Syntrophorhabdus sp. PtaU1.Bin002]|nr:MAG: P-protein [Syntrophorhabdus sp. PtaB.Bin006]OPY71651.1 MAG: P-protein [Syntrophorhabdus sp. PtaU1.Bin002]